MFENFFDNFRSKIGSERFFKTNATQRCVEGHRLHKSEGDEKDFITSKLNGNIFKSYFNFRRNSKDERCDYEPIEMFPRVVGNVNGYECENGNNIELWPSSPLHLSVMPSISMSPEKLEEVVDKFIRIVSEDHCSTQFNHVRIFRYVFSYCLSINLFT